MRRLLSLVLLCLALLGLVGCTPPPAPPPLPVGPDGKPTPLIPLYYFSGVFCPACRDLEQTFANATVRDELRRFQLTKDPGSEFKARYDVTQTPTLVAVPVHGKPVKRVGSQTPAELSEWLRSIK